MRVLVLLVILVGAFFCFGDRVSGLQGIHAQMMEFVAKDESLASLQIKREELQAKLVDLHTNFAVRVEQGQEAVTEIQKTIQEVQEALDQIDATMDSLQKLKEGGIKREQDSVPE